MPNALYQQPTAMMDQGELHHERNKTTDIRLEDSVTSSLERDRMDHISQAPTLQTSIGNIITKERISVQNITFFRAFGKFRKKSKRGKFDKRHHQQCIDHDIVLKTKIIPTKNYQICILRLNILQFPAIATTMHLTVFPTQLGAVSLLSGSNREKPVGVVRNFQ